MRYFINGAFIAPANSNDKDSHSFIFNFINKAITGIAQFDYSNSQNPHWKASLPEYVGFAGASSGPF